MDEERKRFGKLIFDYERATGERFSLNIFYTLPTGWDFKKLNDELSLCIKEKIPLEKRNEEWQEFIESQRKFCRENPDVLI